MNTKEYEQFDLWKAIEGRTKGFVVTYHYTFRQKDERTMEVVEWDEHWLHELKRTRTMPLNEARNLWTKLRADGYWQREELVEVASVKTLTTMGKEIGQEVTFQAAAPGKGYTKYLLQWRGDEIVYGLIIEDTVRKLTPAEVR